jgi:hypothetical protein
MKGRSANLERKLFGGANFLVVLWTLFSIFRLSAIINQNPLDTILTPNFIVFIVPLIFLSVLNVFMGISLFFPQEKNKMWVLSLLMVTVTLIALNSFQLKIDNTKKEIRDRQETPTF